MKAKITIAICFAVMLMLTGCDHEIQIFKDEEAKYRPEPLSNYDLENDKYYVKMGTKFYQVFDADTTGGSGSSVDNTRCAYVWGKYNNKVPTYYSNELIAYASKENTIKDLTCERYKDTGYSIGIYGATYNDGYITFDLNQNSVKDSDAKKKFKNKRSNDIMIETINDEKVTPDMLNKAGVFVGLEKDKTYDITFYAGTYYGEITVEADTHFFQSYEMYSLRDHRITKNGYISITMPEDAKTGYYIIGEKGLFRYMATERGEEDLEAANYNEPYYLTEEDQMAAFSQQFTFDIEASTANGTIRAEYDEDSLAEGQESYIKMMVTAPDGTRLTAEPKEEGVLEMAYTTMMPGKWTVNITPQSMNISSVEVVDNAAAQEKTQNTYTFKIEEEKTGVEFYVIYDGEGEVSGQVIGPDGQSHDLKEGRDVQNGQLGYTYSYLPEGTYTVNVYHDPDTKITKVDYDYNEKNKSEEIITVED